jgi:hypothetical protein
MIYWGTENVWPPMSDLAKTPLDWFFGYYFVYDFDVIGIPLRLAL